MDSKAASGTGLSCRVRSGRLDSGRDSEQVCRSRQSQGRTGRFNASWRRIRVPAQGLRFRRERGGGLGTMKMLGPRARCSLSGRMRSTLQQLVVVLTIFGLSLMQVAVAEAQQSPFIVSLKSGVTRTSHSLSKYAWYNEIQLEKELAVVGLIATSGALYGGFWADGVDEHTYVCRGCVTYSTKSYMAGARVYLNPYANPLAVFFGLTYQSVHQELVASSPFSHVEPQWKNRLHQFTSFEAGLRSVISLADRFAVSSEVHNFWSLKKGKNFGFQPSVKLGVSFEL